MGVSKLLDIVLVAGIGTVALFVLWRFERRRSRLQKANRVRSERGDSPIIIGVSSPGLMPQIG